MSTTVNEMSISFFCFIAFLVGAQAGYSYRTPSVELKTPHLVYGSPSISAAKISQYYTQDSLGQYSYGYSEPLSTKQEIRTADGITRGSYSYLDAVGKLQTVDYTADAGGFRVSGTDLPTNEHAPKPVEETPEVATLRAQHLAAHAEAKLRLTSGRTTFDLKGLPSPVQDTPEVKAAKQEFFKRYEAEKLRHEQLRTHHQQPSSFVINKPIVVKTSSLPIYDAALVPTSGFAYNYKISTPSLLRREYLPAF